jgi:hypothetical protein
MSTDSAPSVSMPGRPRMWNVEHRSSPRTIIDIQRPRRNPSKASHLSSDYVIGTEAYLAAVTPDTSFKANDKVLWSCQTERGGR